LHCNFDFCILTFELFNIFTASILPAPVPAAGQRRIYALYRIPTSWRPGPRLPANGSDNRIDNQPRGKNNHQANNSVGEHFFAHCFGGFAAPENQNQARGHNHNRRGKRRYGKNQKINYVNEANKNIAGLAHFFSCFFVYDWSATLRYQTSGGNGKSEANQKNKDGDKN